MTLLLLIFLPAVLLSACTLQPQQEVTDTAFIHPIHQSPPHSVEEIDSVRLLRKAIADSQTAARALAHALAIAEDHRDQPEYHLQTDSFSIAMGELFVTGQRHLLVGRNLIGMHFTDIYKVGASSFDSLFSNELSYLAYRRDTIFDANGDGQRDFLLHWYPASGCCIRDVYDIWPVRPDGTFADSVQVINPTFSPAEKVIRGIEYGGYAPFYKHRWKGYRIETVEYIFRPDSTSHHCYVRRYHNSRDVPGELLDELPVEYHGIGYDL